MNYYRYIEENNPEVILKELFDFLIDKHSIDNPNFKIYHDTDTSNFIKTKTFDNWTLFLNDLIDVSIYTDNVIVPHIYDSWIISGDIIEDVKYFLKNYKYLNRKKIIDNL